MAPPCRGVGAALALLAAALAAAQPAAETRVVEGPLAATPRAWRNAGPAERGETLELSFFVRQQGLAELERTLLRVSSPSSPEYGQHLRNEEVQRLTAPRAEHLEAVEAFLRGHGLDPRRATPNGDIVTATASVQVAEELLSTSYSRMVHSSGVEVSRALAGYRLPAQVAAAVDFVAPTTHLPGVHRPKAIDAQRNASGVNLSLFNSPKNLRALYSVGGAEGKAELNKQAVTAFLGQGYGKLSLDIFWRMFCGGIKCSKGAPKLVGDATGGLPGTESMLDIETITGVAGNVESEFWGFSGRSPDNPQNEPFMKWLEKLSSTPDADVPKVFSTSYGEDEGSWSRAAAQRLNVEFQKAGVRGISLLFASGDSGPGCKDHKFVPNGPATSPWVTAVGGTGPGKDWPKPKANAEVAVGLASGGFSNYWPMPDWQKAAVGGYLRQRGLPDKSLGYNTSGRAFPDVAAQATQFFVYAGVPLPGVAGTSCASPAAAGVFSLLNDLRLQQGKSTLGFLNPLIYEKASAFYDVTKGSGRSSCGEWPAKPGWDAVTGLGTPNYEKLAAVVSGLPPGRPAQPSTEIVV
uniref:subtilisin n=1 Tax=Alexandrium monilatum TaxID=311494 RepID=A0A7S4S9L0_9DINO